MVVKISPEDFLLLAPVTGISLPSGVIKVMDKGCLNVTLAGLVDAVPMAPDKVTVLPLMLAMVVPVSVEPKYTLSPTAKPVADVTATVVLAVVVLAVVVVLLSLLKKDTEAPLGTVTASLVVSVVPLMDVTVTPESTPLMNTFMPAVTVTAEPALLGTAVKLKVLVVEAALVKVEATGDVLTRNTVSLFKVTLVVPKVLGDAELLGV